MPAPFGVNVEFKNKTGQDLTVASTTVIGICGKTADKEDARFQFFPSVGEALEAFSGNVGVSASLTDVGEQNVKCPIIVSTAKNVADAVEKLRGAKREFGYPPDLIAAPGHCGETGVVAKMQSIAEYASAMALFDLKANAESDAVNEVGGYGSKRLFPLFGSATVARDGREVKRPLSGLVAGMIAKWDGSIENGWGHSPSNRVLNGVVGGGVDYESGQDCAAMRLRGKQINCLIRERGFRLHGDCTTSAESVWADIKRVRIFDKIGRAALDGLFFAIDRNALNVLPNVKDGVRNMLSRLTGAGILLGNDVAWDEEWNSKSEIDNGRFYLGVDMQETPSVKRLLITFNKVDRYSETLINKIS